MEVTGSSVPPRESRSAPSVRRLSRRLVGLLIVCCGVGWTYAIYQAWKADQPVDASQATAADDAAVEAELASPATVPQQSPVKLAADRDSQQPSDPGIAQAGFESPETTVAEFRAQKQLQQRTAWLTGTIEAADEQSPPVGKPIPTFDRPLLNPPAIDP